VDRLIQTSAGWVVLDLDENRWTGRSVSLTPFDPGGWERDGKLWVERYGYHERGEELSAFLKAALDIPADEAEQLAQAIEGPWREDWVERGGPAHTREIERLVAITMGVLALGAILAVTALVLILWLLLT
jgi:hypothetical protein